MRLFSSLFIILSLSVAVSCSSGRSGKACFAVDGGNITVSQSGRSGGVPDIRRLVEREKPVVDSVRRPVLGYAAIDLVTYAPESPMMNFAADALLEGARKYSSYPVDAAVTNKGGLRSPIKKGNITFGDVYDVFTFDNTLAIVTFDGATLLQLCHDIATVGGEAVSGLTLVITADNRLVDAKVNGESISPESKYRIATSNYLSEGKDKLYSFVKGECEVYDAVTIRDLMVEYICGLTARGEVLSPECDGRITIMK